MTFPFSIAPKRLLGLLAMALSVGMGLFLALHPFLLKGGLQVNLFLSVPLWLILWRLGRKWFRNELDLNLVALPSDDPLVLESIRRARAHLEEVRSQLHADRLEIHLKFGLTTLQGEVEHIWCIAHHLDEGDNVTLSLANEPAGNLGIEGRFVRPLGGYEDFFIGRKDDLALGGYSLVALARSARTRGYAIPSAFLPTLENSTAWQEWGSEP